MPTMSIGQLAKQAAVGVDTVRFYEKYGLLPKAPRKPSGYRQYGTDHARQLAFIRRAKELGFSLSDIAELLKLRNGRNVARVRGVAQRNLLAVERKIAELQRLRAVLKELVATCPGSGAAEQCPILRAFDDMGTVPRGQRHA